MEQDSEGFLYPVADDKNCTGCAKCEKSCPAIISNISREPLNVFAAKNPNEEIRHQSSSGGVFSLLSECIIQKGGVVFGARFNNTWEVIHDYTETMDGLVAFRGSKYVQSATRNTYKQTREFLESGRKVLYSGTPCQIAGLKAFLQKDYIDLLTVDFVCHGVPSPLVWKKYLNEIICNKFYKLQDISNIEFRNKKYGWGRGIYHFVITFSDKKTFSSVTGTNSYLMGFSRDLYLRHSCHNCLVKSFKSGSDITIADYWGIGNILPEFDDKKGVSLVMVNSEQGKEVYEILNKNDQETTYLQALAHNPMIEKSAGLHKKRVLFFKNLHNETVISLIDRLILDSCHLKMKRMISVLLWKSGLFFIFRSLIRR